MLISRKLSLWDHKTKLYEEARKTKYISEADVRSILLSEAIIDHHYDHIQHLLDTGVPIEKCHISQCNGRDDWKCLYILLQYEWSFSRNDLQNFLLGSKGDWKRNPDMPWECIRRIQKEKIR